MIHKTKGVVFRFTRYGETSIIVTIFTELFGLQSYMVNGIRSKNARNKIALYQPLTLLNLVVYHRESANIERIREASLLYPYRTLTSDIRKSTLAIFLTELMNKTIREESHTSAMFSFIAESLVTLDELEKGYENFHLIFMLRLARNLGFGVDRVDELLGERIADGETERLLAILITADYVTPVRMTNLQRREILDVLLRFYHRHIEQLGEIKSVQVLREIFM